VVVGCGACQGEVLQWLKWRLAWCMILRERWHGGVIGEVAMEARRFVVVVVKTWQRHGDWLGGDVDGCW